MTIISKYLVKCRIKISIIKFYALKIKLCLNLVLVVASVIVQKLLFLLFVMCSFLNNSKALDLLGDIFVSPSVPRSGSRSSQQPSVTPFRHSSCKV